LAGAPVVYGYNRLFLVHSGETGKYYYTIQVGIAMERSGTDVARENTAWSGKRGDNS